MFSKVWDSFLVVSKWILFGLSCYFLLTAPFSLNSELAFLFWWGFDSHQRIRALEKNQESQAS